MNLKINIRDLIKIISVVLLIAGAWYANKYEIKDLRKENIQIKKDNEEMKAQIEDLEKQNVNFVAFQIELKYIKEKVDKVDVKTEKIYDRIINGN